MKLKKSLLFAIYAHVNLTKYTNESIWELCFHSHADKLKIFRPPRLQKQLGHVIYPLYRIYPLDRDLSGG